MTTQRQARTARRTLAELLTFSIIVATLQVVGATEPATANDPEVGVNIHVVKVDDQDGDGSINFNTHPRLSGVAFDLYLDGATTPDSSITTTYSGIVTGVLNSDIIGTAPVGTPYVICESVPAGWTNTNPTLAPDPENNGRPC
ncbi:MAG: hypothetical protein GY926_07030, partial [bacterium]|nr:hypothetical protein [bacterium]